MKPCLNMERKNSLSWGFFNRHEIQYKITEIAENPKNANNIILQLFKNNELSPSAFTELGTC